MNNIKRRRKVAMSTSLEFRNLLSLCHQSSFMVDHLALKTRYKAKKLTRQPLMQYLDFVTIRANPLTRRGCLPTRRGNGFALSGHCRIRNQRSHHQLGICHCLNQQLSTWPIKWQHHMHLLAKAQQLFGRNYDCQNRSMHKVIKNKFRRT